MAEIVAVSAPWQISFPSITGRQTDGERQHDPPLPEPSSVVGGG